MSPQRSQFSTGKVPNLVAAVEQALIDYSDHVRSSMKIMYGKYVARHIGLSLLA